MKKKYFYLVLSLIIISLISWFIQWFWVIIIVLIFVNLLIMIYRSVKRKSVKTNTYVVFTLIFSFSIYFIKPINDFEFKINQPDLYLQLYKSDQSDRMNLKAYLFKNIRVKMKKRDSIRLNLVMKQDSLNKIIDPLNKFYSAMIYQHGYCPKHFERAYELSKEAAKYNIKNAKWLSKASYDRWQLSLNKPQKYGTQFK